MRASVLVGVFWRGEELAAGRVVVRETKNPQLFTYCSK